MSVADPEIDQLDEAIVTVPRPPKYMPTPPEYARRQRWHRACIIAIAAILIVAYPAAFGLYLVNLLTHNFVPERKYVPLVQGTVQIFVFVVCWYAIKEFERRVKSWQCRKPSLPSLTIFPSGVAHEGQFVGWQNIRSCRWNRYNPDKLVIAVNGGQTKSRHAVSVPESHRALVEDTFRRFGKWDQPGEADEMASETAMSLNLSPT